MFEQFSFKVGERRKGMKRGKYKWRSQGEGEEVRQKTLYIRMMMMGVVQGQG